MRRRHVCIGIVGRPSESRHGRRVADGRAVQATTRAARTPLMAHEPGHTLSANEDAQGQAQLA